GTYPYVTSSNATVGGAVTGLGVPPTAIKEVIGVVKAYQTRVGAGPFPTELKDAVGDKLQSIGREIGVTTGRKRRCGLALTKLDVLDNFEEIKAAVGYKLDGHSLRSPPSCAEDWDQVEVEYQTFPGWNTSTSNVRKFEDLPEECRNYVCFIEQFVGVPIKWIGVGEERESLIVR
uniref:Adenylosuccinate synthetase n=1 Tax=Parascaris equorum TaxID=6256 RepID=A0A914RXH5_PAREQ